jgi:hypothetical protein
MMNASKHVHLPAEKFQISEKSEGRGTFTRRSLTTNKTFSEYKWDFSEFLPAGGECAHVSLHVLGEVYGVRHRDAAIFGNGGRGGGDTGHGFLSCGAL